MQKFIDHIEKSLPDNQENKLLFKFKRKTLDEMNAAYADAMSRGINNERVMSDLVISEYPDLQARYIEYYKTETAKSKAKRNTIINIVGSVVYILSLIIVFLGLGFTTHDWGHLWVIVVDGILLWIAYLLTLGVDKITKMKRVFHIFARILLGIDVMVISVAAFIFALAIMHIPHSWTIVIAGIATIFIADGVYSLATKQKFAIINWLIYIPAVFTMLFIILGAVNILPWAVGWLLILVGLLLDFFIVLIALAKNKQDDMEVYDSWTEG